MFLRNIGLSGSLLIQMLEGKEMADMSPKMTALYHNGKTSCIFLGFLR